MKRYTSKFTEKETDKFHFIYIKDKDYAKAAHLKLNQLSTQSKDDFKVLRFKDTKEQKEAEKKLKDAKVDFKSESQEQYNLFEALSSSYERNFAYFKNYFDKLFQQKSSNIQAEANAISDAMFSAFLDLYSKKQKDDKKAEDKAAKLALFVSKRMKYLHDQNPQSEENEQIS